MKTKKGTKIVTALIWATVLIIVSLLLKTFDGKDQLINFLIIASAITVSLYLNETNKLSCKHKNLKQRVNYLFNNLK